MVLPRYPKFSFSETISPNPNNERLGYKGTNFIQLTGTLLVTFVVSSFAYFVFKMVNFLFKKHYENPKIRSAASHWWKLREKILNVLVKFCSEGYLEICNPLFIAISGFRVQQEADWVAFVAQYAGISILMIPFALIYFLNSNFDDLDNIDFRSKYGFLYKDLKINTKY